MLIAHRFDRQFNLEMQSVVSLTRINNQEVLGLDFDLELEYKKRSPKTTNQQLNLDSDSQYLDQS